MVAAGAVTTAAVLAAEPDLEDNNITFIHRYIHIHGHIFKGQIYIIVFKYACMYM
jgi:hypothetical protein